MKKHAAPIPSSPSFASAFSASRGPLRGVALLCLWGSGEAGMLAVGRRIRPAGEIIHLVVRRLADHSAFAGKHRPPRPGLSAAPCAGRRTPSGRRRRRSARATAAQTEGPRRPRPGSPCRSHEGQGARFPLRRPPCGQRLNASSALPGFLTRAHFKATRAKYGRLKPPSPSQARRLRTLAENGESASSTASTCRLCFWRGRAFSALAAQRTLSDC